MKKTMSFMILIALVFGGAFLMKPSEATSCAAIQSIQPTFRCVHRVYFTPHWWNAGGVDGIDENGYYRNEEYMSFTPCPT